MLFRSPKIKRISEIYTDVGKFYCGGEKEWRFCGFFTSRDIERLSCTKLSDAKNIIDRCNQLGYSVISIDDDSYPKCLYNIDSPPAVLYVSGKLPDIDNQFSIGIVGTRRATQYGIKNSYKFADAPSTPKAPPLTTTVPYFASAYANLYEFLIPRSEERRVGKECG